MILILTEQFDKPSQNVIEELKLRNANFKIICGNDLLEKDFVIDIKNRHIQIDKIGFEDINIV